MDVDISILYHQKSTGSPIIKSVIEFLVENTEEQFFL
jgi:hypothetical protein